MPLKRRPDPFSHPDWLYEIKHDGFRALAFVQDGKCRLVSRNGNEFKNFSALALSLPKELGAKAAVLDGEVCCLDSRGISQFNDLLFKRGEPRFYAFDLIWCDGKDLRYEGLQERKRQLKALIAGRERLLYCDYLEERGEDLFRFVCENDLEGIAAKPRNSPYVFSESDTSWLKIKNRDYSQQFGRDDLFVPLGEPKPVVGSWDDCTITCAELEL